MVIIVEEIQFCSLGCRFRRRPRRLGSPPLARHVISDVGGGGGVVGASAARAGRSVRTQKTVLDQVAEGMFMKSGGEDVMRIIIV